jgi:hypothetical protein
MFNNKLSYSIMRFGTIKAGVKVVQVLSGNARIAGNAK